jgi:regulator of protease activity HflC (stomatin/prohibitin superfamily)
MDAGLLFGLIVLGLVFLFFVLLFSIRIVRPTEKGLVERLGRFAYVVGQGLHFLVPFVDRMYLINLTERMVGAEPQEVITSDNLNAIVDAQVYFKVRSDDDSVKKSIYSVNDYETQIVALARTTLRDVIGNLSLKDANSQRNKINEKLQGILQVETHSWGIDIVRTELKEIQPPADVQETMNKVVKAENEKVAAIDFATARETEADGMRRAAIKSAEGERQAAILSAEGDKLAKILRAEGDAEAIRLVNESARKYFKDEAQQLRKIQMVEASLQNNTKYIVPENASLINLLSDSGGITLGAAQQQKKTKEKTDAGQQ